VPVAVAPREAFDRVHSKIEFARLLDSLGLPQPGWRLVRGAEDLADLAFPYWLKAPFSTAGQGVRQVRDARSRSVALEDLLGSGSAVAMAQEPARGQYGQVQALFDHGRLIAVHTSVQVGTGIGGSAAARRSVDHPVPRRDVALLGEALGWHGGLTLDYMHRDGSPQYIECNPRTVEPANACASGVNLPELQVRLTLGESFGSSARVGRAGVRTHGTIALLLGVAAARGTRRAVVGELARAALRHGPYRASAEQLTPVVRDPVSAVALAVVVARVLGSPTAAARVAGAAIARYSVTADTVSRLDSGSSDSSA
jgi:biotin carboxylase